ncbi:hypothetical protein HPB49_019921 [Dermacentor silvarum]|uniref:Uncharacterized protein n=1 Tax=Dermacentor silvarum TaxID=543639 RepID=A0ACB8E2S7_DERSI|nr:hypothetical protein HPB49_019921 [Dermacentor silvarum]
MQNDYETVAYVTAPEDTSKGAIRGIPEEETQKDIAKSLVNQRNTGILHVRRMGKTNIIIIAFEGQHVPHYVFYKGAKYRCLQYKKKHEVCQLCGCLGHTGDVCPNPKNVRCRGCRAANPGEDHKCTPRCHLCGKEHQIGDKKCKELFRTPYIMKKRQWK